MSASNTTPGDRPELVYEVELVVDPTVPDLDSTIRRAADPVKFYAELQRCSGDSYMRDRLTAIVACDILAGPAGSHWLEDPEVTAVLRRCAADWLARQADRLHEWSVVVRLVDDHVDDRMVDLSGRVDNPLQLFSTLRKTNILEVLDPGAITALFMCEFMKSVSTDPAAYPSPEHRSEILTYLATDGYTDLRNAIEEILRTSDDNLSDDGDLSDPDDVVPIA
ncbi:hypothetical protein ACWF82_29940 [Nocardia sp. NPDC055053]